MNVLCLLCALGVVLPNAGEVPVLEAGASLALAPVNGQVWFRVLERDYALLDLEVIPGGRLTAYYDNGDVVITSLNGRLVLSAYSAYWFWVMAESAAPVVVSLENRLPETVRLPYSGEVGAGVMAQAFRVAPETSGRHQIRLTGDSAADLDLEIYGAGNRLWAGSYSPDSNEKVIIDLLATDTVTVLVSRYKKGGTGQFTLDIQRIGDFRVLEGSVRMQSRPDRIERFLLPQRRRMSLLHLAFQGDDDLDLFVRGEDQMVLWSSTSYSPSEMIMIPGGNETLVAEVVNYPGDDGENPWFVLLLSEPDTVVTSPAGTLSMEISGGIAPLICYSPGSEGFYRVSSLFEKTHSGTLRLFRRPGEASVLMATQRGDEEFMAWIGEADSVWIAPGFARADREGECVISLEPGTPSPVQSEARHSVHHTGEMTRYFTAGGDRGSILVIRLSGEPNELDMDMLVSGPGFDLQAQGGESHTDSASDEAVAVYCEASADYGITVYSYDRVAQGSFSISVENIPVHTLAPGTPEPETWAILVGISGYSDLVDILSRCSMDAMDMREFLLGQGVRQEQMVILVDQTATVEAFENAIQSVIGRAGPEDRLVVFFSGHGSRQPPGSGGPEEPDTMNEVLCFYDGNIVDDHLAESVRRFPGMTMLFLDACHSGGFVHDFSREDNILILTAAREDLTVSERILTPILLQGSRGEADANGDRRITARELVDYVDRVLQRVCPFCDTILDDGPSRLCQGCGEVLKGENRIPRPQQGLYTNPDRVIWTVN